MFYYKAVKKQYFPVLCLDDSLLKNGSFTPSAGPQPIPEPVQVQYQATAIAVSQNQVISPRMVQAMIGSPQPMVTSPVSHPQYMTSHQTVTPRQSPVVLTARNPSHVFNGNPATATTSAKPIQTSTLSSNQVNYCKLHLSTIY